MNYKSPFVGLEQVRTSRWFTITQRGEGGNVDTVGREPEIEMLRRRVASILGLRVGRKQAKLLPDCQGDEMRKKIKGHCDHCLRWDVEDVRLVQFRRYRPTGWWAVVRLCGCCRRSMIGLWRYAYGG